MSHTTIHIRCTESEAELVSSILLDWDYDGTSYEGNELVAYVNESIFNKDELEELLSGFDLTIEQIYSTHEQNWNELWEANFKDLYVGSDIHVRAPFHASSHKKHEIIIHPKMAFGTGHHGTTQLMLEAMLALDFKDKDVLDMGCGSGILAILAAQKGAKEVLAIDYDINSVENSIENMQLNQITNVSILQAGNLEKVPNTFDIILSNIVKNINLALVPEFSTHLRPGGTLLLCGLLIGDLDEVRTATEALNLKYCGHSEDGEWLQITFEKVDA